MNIYFILWMCLFPISSSLASLIEAKKRAISGQPDTSSEEARGISALIMVFIWLFTGYHLFDL